MQAIQNLRLPARLPGEDAIRSFGDNRHGYEPEFWEFQYRCYRYLERAPEGALADRYEAILRNMRALVSRERDAIPIQSFLSSWYWFRKEHQTRFEYFLRGLPLPVAPPFDATFDNSAPEAPARPAHPNAGDVLFRYDRLEHVSNLANRGLIRIRPASDFKGFENDGARQDEECVKKAFLPGRHTRVTTRGGLDIPILGDVERTTSAPNYYVFCMACDWDPDLFSTFDGADACVVVRDAEKFARRLERAAMPQLPNWYFHHNPVEYFDPYERVRNGYFEATMCKDFKFAYQREYRFLWAPMNGERTDGFKHLSLGDLRGLADVYDSSGKTQGIG